VDPNRAATSQWPVYQWKDVPAGPRFKGPALIEDPYTTVVVSSFFGFEMDERLSIHLWDKESVDAKQ
jgi:hypothetical protein